MGRSCQKLNPPSFLCKPLLLLPDFFVIKKERVKKTMAGRVSVNSLLPTRLQFPTVVCCIDCCHISSSYWVWEEFSYSGNSITVCLKTQVVFFDHLSISTIRLTPKNKTKKNILCQLQSTTIRNARQTTFSVIHLTEWSQLYRLCFLRPVTDELCLLFSTTLICAISQHWSMSDF